MSEPPTPKQPAEQVLRMYTPRRGVVRLNRKAVAIIVAVIGLLLGGAIMFSLNGSIPPIDQDAFDEEFGRAPTHAIDAGPLGQLPQDYRYTQRSIESGNGSLPTPAPSQSKDTEVPASTPPINPALLAQYQALQQRLEEGFNSPLVFTNIRSQNSLDSKTRTSSAGVPATGKITAASQSFNVVPRNLDDGNNLTFLRNVSRVPTHVQSKLTRPRSPYEIQAGTVIPGALVTALQSDLPGTVIGQVTENVYDTVAGKHLLIPQGSRLIGRYNNQLVVGQERLFVVWQRLILPNGNSIVLEGMPAADSSGASGLEDRVDHHIDKVLGATVLSSLIAYGGNLAKGQSQSKDGLSTVGETVAQQASRVGQRIVDRQLNVQPTVTIRAGWPFVVLVNKDMTLKPFKRNVR